MPAFNPKGKTFNQRLDAFIDDAKNSHKVVVQITRKGTTPQWQQKYHVAHMFAHNNYLKHKPANTEKGKRTIAWAHFSDAKVIWNTAKWTDFLKTKTGLLPQKNAQAWTKGFEPDQAKTMTHVKQMLKAGGIGKGGTAQVSAGVKPCGEPCKCTVGVTRHLGGKAADLNSNDLKTLGAKLQAAKAGTLDQYIKTFGLHRPLVKHPTSPEPWHFEALP